MNLSNIKQNIYMLIFWSQQKELEQPFLHAFQMKNREKNVAMLVTRIQIEENKESVEK